MEEVFTVIINIEGGIGLTIYGEPTAMFNGVSWSVSSTRMILLKDDDAGHDVVQKDLQGSGEVGLILQVTGSGGDG